MRLRDYEARVKAGKVPIDIHGHHSYYFEAERVCEGLQMQIYKRANEALEAGAPRTSIEETENLYNPELTFPVLESGNILRNCGICDQQPTVTYHEDRIELQDNHIEPYPFTVDIECPSGNLLFNDTYPNEAFTHKDHNVNSCTGLQKCSEELGEQDLMHFFVGNSCPVVWKEGNTLFIGSLPEDSKREAVGQICTDLWWASVIDTTILTRRLIAKVGLEESDTLGAIEHMRSKGGQVKMKPGTYRCTSYYHMGEMDYGDLEAEQIYCKLELVS